MIEIFAHGETNFNRFLFHQIYQSFLRLILRLFKFKASGYLSHRFLKNRSVMWSLAFRTRMAHTVSSL